MRVSEYYELGVTQPSLEFLDVDVVGDTRVFVDPQAIRALHTDWARECIALLQSFWDEVMDSVDTGDRRRGEYLLARLAESNEAHLGLSSADASGSGISYGLARDIYDALLDSEAVASGLLENIEEAVLFVRGVGRDRISDATINIIRRPLIAFTQRMSHLYDIPLVEGVASGPMWDHRTRAWSVEFVDLPMGPAGPLLLVPRSIVRKNTSFDPGDYLSHFVLPHLQEVELSSASSLLVRRRRSGERYVTKKSILQQPEAPLPVKQWNNVVTLAAPEVLHAYRDAKKTPAQPPDHEELADAAGTPLPDWDALLGAVLEIPTGAADADRYHRAVQRLLTALFYPGLDWPERESRIHDGRKRIDITFSNIASEGFFHWLNAVARVMCPFVVVECKNYTDALGNGEFDQLTGRFSDARGRFGFLCYRGAPDEKTKVLERCRDAFRDGRGIVIALDDDDLRDAVEARKVDSKTLWKYLQERYREIIS